jgi:hypothetical protein
VVRCAQLVVVNHGIVPVLIPNFDAEPVFIYTRRSFGVNGINQKTIIAVVVDFATAPEHGFASGNHQRVISPRTEVQIGDSKLKHGSAPRRRLSFDDGQEPEVGSAPALRFRRVRSPGRVDKAEAKDASPSLVQISLVHIVVAIISQHR